MIRSKGKLGVPKQAKESVGVLVPLKREGDKRSWLAGAMMKRVSSKNHSKCMKAGLMMLSELLTSSHEALALLVSKSHLRQLAGGEIMKMTQAKEARDKQLTKVQSCTK